jgi:hypothetical protein
MNVRLETEAGEYVTTVRLPRFVKEPGVILWGERFFIPHGVTGGYAATRFGGHTRSGSTNDRIYREAFVVQAVNESEMAI